MVVGSMALTLFGAGAVSRALDVYDSAVWLWSSESGSTQRVNLEAGKVDTRYAIKDAKHHDVVIVQTDTHLLLHDRTAGTITSVDLAKLDEGGRIPVRPGTNSSVAMWNETVLLVDAPKGQIRRLDPKNLEAKSEVLQLPVGLIPGGFDNEGSYWTASPKDGAVWAVVADKGSTKLRVEQKVSVAQPDHKLALTALNQGSAVIDQTSNAVVVVNKNKTHSVQVPGLDSAIVAARTTSSAIAVTVPDSRQVVLIENGQVRTIKVAGNGSLGEAIVFAGRVYVVEGSQAVLALDDPSGKLDERIPMSAGATAISMEQREGALIINEPGGSSGYIVDKSNNIKKVTKYPGSGTDPGSDSFASNSPKKQTPPATTPEPSQPAVQSTPTQSPGPTQNSNQAQNPVPTQNRKDNQPADKAQPVKPAQPSPATPGPSGGVQGHAPGTPVLENVRAGDGEITLDYYPPNDTGGSELTAIDIYCNNNRVLHDTKPGNGTRNASFAASNGVACTVQGYAVNSTGSSAAAIGGTVTPESAAPAPAPNPAPSPTPTPTPTPPATNNSVPTGVRAVAASGGIQVTWNAVTVPAGSQLDNYKVYACTTDGTTCIYTFTSSRGTSATFPRPNGGYGTGGRFRVTSVIDGKESAQSELSNAVQ